MSVAVSEWVQDNVFPNKLGVLTLDRPKALNAADKCVTAALMQKLQEWRRLGEIRGLLIRSTSEKAFCSGGDVKAIALDLKGDAASQTPFIALSNEYRLLCMLHSLSKSSEHDMPSVAIMDGVTMGFGLGLACTTRYRVITERTLVAMPENAIGLFPDVGFAYLTRHEPALGLYLALTGARLGAKSSPPADIIALGLATHYVPSEQVSTLISALQAADLSKDADAAISTILSAHAQDCREDSTLDALRPLVHRCFNAREMSSVQEVMAALQLAIDQAPSSKEVEGEANTAVLARSALAAMKEAPPMSLAVTFAHFRNIRLQMEAVGGGGVPPSLEAVLSTEYRLATRMCLRPDFAEGVRARLIDKDNSPVWTPASLADVNAQLLAACFAPMAPEAELHTSLAADTSHSTHITHLSLMHADASHVADKRRRV